MLTGVALIPQTSHSFGVGGLVFIFAVVFVIVLIFVFMYRRGDQSRRTAHGSAPTTHRAPRVPERDGNHGHQAKSKRRRHRP
jgi:uncharacterized membrane protein